MGLIPASGPSLGEAEWKAMHDAVDSHWLTAGPVNGQFERALGAFTGHSYVHTCNSGSSANLLAVAALVEAGFWKPGDEIITAACAFPTTVNPLLLYGLVPVFVDVEIGSYNVSQKTVDRAITPRTRGVMLAHTLGNPYALSLPDDIHLIEDCCDALGATVSGNHVGHRGRLATVSFFPAHHITTGEGGAVFTNDLDLAKLVESVRDWGRDCYCEPGRENTCGKRFEHEWQILPKGTDHKYVYSRLGFNLKSTEVAAACGVTQLKRLSEFVGRRRSNFQWLGERLQGVSAYLILPHYSDGASPFGFPVTIREEGQRTLLQEYLKQQGVDSRTIFSGNLTRQPYFAKRNYRISGSLKNSDKILTDSFWVGVHPSLSQDDLEKIAVTIEQFFGVF